MTTFRTSVLLNDNGSVLPRVVPKTEALLSRVSKEQIINIINNFSFSKAQGYDGISVSIKIINNFSFNKAHGYDGIFVSIKIINNFSSNKAHGYDGIFVSMLKICAAEIAIPLQIIFLNCINSAIFPDCWKFANVQPIYKKK